MMTARRPPVEIVAAHFGAVVLEEQSMMKGSEMILARYYAERAIKAEWQRAGVKVAYVDGKDLNIAACEYLHEHLNELIGEAKLTLAEWESSPRYRSFVENSPTAQHRKPRKPTP
jgi:hypothetical protein